MSEEEKFECVFGLGECKVLKWLSEQMKTSALAFKAQQCSQIPAELEPLAQYMEGLLRQMSGMMTLSNLGYFCLACVELKKAQVKILEDETYG